MKAFLAGVEEGEVADVVAAWLDHPVTLEMARRMDERQQQWSDACINAVARDDVAQARVYAGQIGAVEELREVIRQIQGESVHVQDPEEDSTD